MRREAFDGEWPSYSDFLIVDVGLVVEVFDLSLGSDGIVNLFLSSDALRPPFRVQVLRSIGPLVVGVARDFPFFPMLLKRRVELFAQGFEPLLEVFPDDINLCVVGD